ncbi:prolipoprotein diacylglyceryl transferase [Chrysiogenes arsenatis]|uniref:prolipoprotein diacylglyceryl transferase n=1 Tax=Chrysiogenes arsenatis TaxID=309797 RepID=UPI0003FBC3A1|nr:prolipoprotein diacylglyceryl transferase [Chrysiogenes arsenatis]
MDPILFSVYGFSLRYYSLMYILAGAIAFGLVHFMGKERHLQLSSDQIADMVSLGLLGGIIGARVYYVAFNWSFYAANPLDALAIWHGGLAIHGGIIGGTIAVWWYTKRRNIDQWHIADIAALCVLVGQACGRFGNFMNGDAHGIPTDLPWGVVFPASSIAGTEYPGIAIHPVMLYELVLNLLVFAALFAFRKRICKGGIMGYYLIAYGVIRVITSTFRADDLYLFGMKAPYLASMVMVIAGFWILQKRRSGNGKVC